MLLRLKDRLFATFLLLSLLPILFFCFLFYKEAQEAVYGQYETSIGKHLNLIDEKLILYFRSMQKETSFLAENPMLKVADSLSDVSSLRSVFFHFAHSHEAVGNIHLLRDDLRTFSMREEPGWDSNSHRPFWLSQEDIGLKDSQVWLYSRLDQASSQKSMFVSQRVRNNEGKPVGILLVEIKLDLLANWLKSNILHTHKELMVLSPTGKILIHSDQAKLGKQVQDLSEYGNLSRSLKTSPEGEVFSFRENGRLVYAYLQVSPTSGNVYVEWLPGDDITSRLDRLHIILLCTIFLIVGFSSYVAHRLSCWISKPIYTLVQATDVLLKGDFSVRVPIQGMEEITLLERKFNQMAEQLHILIGREREYLQKELDQIVSSFYLAVEMKDPYTAGHTERVTHYALIIYDHMDPVDGQTFSRDDLRYASLMHDIGKVAIPDDVLLKNGRLTEEEYERMKQHSSIGADIVEQIESLAHVSPGVRHHHERWDGHGYPDRLKGEEIPLIGRILAVADTFDAMTSTRSYRKAMTATEAYEEILRGSQSQFDPKIVKVFQQAFENGAFQVKQRD
ncbi:HD domain-containing phosphohydrolase [uncultured Brevibacillus sp.]|uniref:HD domain-containing phosphohydrolase n=1 Tax=uncultured Brevibacillus sp. TaxID=169970 RepID=UPI002591C2AD|nr:HD domain-containing phosphohydrolase [uncultured Brevibacillus sp.]